MEQGKKKKKSKKLGPKAQQMNSFHGNRQLSNNMKKAKTNLIFLEFSVQGIVPLGTIILTGNKKW